LAPLTTALRRKPTKVLTNAYNAFDNVNSTRGSQVINIDNLSTVTNNARCRRNIAQRLSLPIMDRTC
jgi:hypothetical protein